MPAQKIDLATLVAKAGYLFRTNGYHHTSIADIAEFCGVKKASIYHHIASKKQLATQALAQTHAHFKETVLSVAYLEEHSAEQRLHQLAQKIASFFEHNEGGCLFCNLAMETMTSEPDLHEHYTTFFNDWTEALTALLQTQYDQQQATQLAEQAVAALQGGIMMMRLYKDANRLQTICNRLPQLLTEKHELHAP